MNNQIHQLNWDDEFFELSELNAMLQLDIVSQEQWEDTPPDSCSPFTLKVWGPCADQNTANLPGETKCHSPVCVYEDENFFVVDFGMEGVNLPDVEVDISEHSILLKGSQRSASAPEMTPIWESWPEDGAGFEWNVAFPTPILKEEVRYQLHNDLLTIYLPKEETCAPNPIQIHFEPSERSVPLQ